MESSDNEKQFIDLVTQYQGKLFGYIYSQMANPEATREILQETNIVIWKKREQFEFGTSFNAWSKSIAHFQMMAYKQKRRRDRLVFDDEVLERLDKESDRVEEVYDIRKEKLNRCISQLKEKYQNFVTKRYRDGTSVNQIADEEGVPANTVTQALFRVRQKLIDCVKSIEIGKEE
ncbi:MAG: sigma-70 family RNA polymerase sigma factor [Lentisphaeraceae bacterium]|nr:sigma-70 family RNA polymerase sigma factor [Lentisphaeraceae bacterium]